jgi:hypothetical protein
MSSPTPTWLTRVLRDSGSLPQGQVTAVESSDSGAFNSLTRFLRLEYSPDAPPALSRRLVLKQPTAESWSIEAARLETNFYTLIRALPGYPAIHPPCLAAGEEAGSAYLLLADLSETHRPPLTREQQIALVDGVPLPAYQEACIDTLAQLHAYWWQHPLLFEAGFDVGYWSRDETRFGLYLERRKAAYARLLAQEGSAFPGQLRDFYTALFAGLPSFYQSVLAPRFQARRGLTLIHGDAFFTNFLVPRAPGAAPTCLLDWQSPCVDLNGYDLANLLASFWTPAQRHAADREIRLLKRYHARLTGLGVTRYTWDDLCADYRAGLVFWALMPIQDAGDGAPRSYWQPKMDCLVSAYQDWCGQP